MTYSSMAKSELCRIRPESACCQLAEAYGLLLYAKLLSDGHNSYSTDNSAIAHLIGETAASVCGVYADVLTLPKHKSSAGNTVSSGNRFAVRIPNAEQKKLMCAAFAGGNGSILEKECCINAFLRGAFLVCGTVTDPMKDYHMEFLAGSERRGDILAGAMERVGIRAHRLNRNERCVVYVKDVDGIMELMTRMGAPYAAGHVAQTRVVRDCRNNANRRVNCDQANIDRTLSASEQQCAAIRKLIEGRGLEAIPQELREIAALRLENPDMSLRELSESLSEPISRSGVNHRLKKLMEMAEEKKRKAKRN